jgi:hypothetical protein
MLKRVRKSQIIEVVVPASSTALRFPFPDQPQLRNKFVQGIEFFNVKDVPTAPSTNAVLSAANLSKTFVTFYVNDKTESGEFLQFPCSTLHRTQLSGATASSDIPFVQELTELHNKEIDFSKSYLTATATVSSGSATSYLLTVYYTDQPISEK